VSPSQSLISSKQAEKLIKKSTKKILSENGISPTRSGNKELDHLVTRLLNQSFGSPEAATRAGEELGQQIVGLSQKLGKTNLDQGIIRRLILQGDLPVAAQVAAPQPNAPGAATSSKAAAPTPASEVPAVQTSSEPEPVSAQDSPAAAETADAAPVVASETIQQSESPSAPVEEPAAAETVLPIEEDESEDDADEAALSAEVIEDEVDDDLTLQAEADEDEADKADEATEDEDAEDADEIAPQAEADDEAEDEDADEIVLQAEADDEEIEDEDTEDDLALQAEADDEEIEDEATEDEDADDDRS
jgi:hypothetical protein